MKLIKTLTYSVIALVIMAGILYYFRANFITSSTNYSGTYTAYDALQTTNADFTLGETLAAQGNLAGAKAALESALPLAPDNFQTGVIQFDLALIQIATDPIGAIASLETIATNPTYAYATRAYALQYISQIYYDALNNRESSASLQSIVSATFNNNVSPFPSMLTNGQVSLAYRRIYDLADSLYPLPIPEAMSAQWYVNNMFATATTIVSSSTLAVNKAQIDSNFSALDSAIQTTSSDHTLDGFAANALSIKAGVIRKLSYLGFATNGEVSAAYQRAIDASDMSTVPPLSDAYARYDYAIYLSFTPDTTKVGSVLAPIYTNQGYASSPFGKFLKSLATDTSSLHTNAIHVSTIDPQFKAYLVSLGWNQSNFAK